MIKAGRITLEDVARRAGVSRATASRVIRGDVAVSPRKVRAVERAVAELGYVPSSAARALAAGRAGIVAVIIPEPDRTVFSDPFFADTVATVSHAVAEWDTQVVLTFDSSTHEPTPPAHAAATHGAPASLGSQRTAAFLASGAVDGAIVVSHHQFNGQVQAYAQAPVPVVFVGRPVGVEETALWVDSDNYGGGTQVAEHFLACGVRRPAVVTGPMDMVASQDRLRGFREVMARAGYDVDVLTGDFTAQSGAAAAAALVPRITGGDIDAVFFANDLMALAAMDTWQHAGLSAPRDLLVASYDDIEAAAQRGLTSVVNSATELAAAATDVLLARLRGQSEASPRILPAHLLIRSTTQP